MMDLQATGSTVFFLSWMRQLLKPSFSKNFPRFPYQFCLLIIIPMVDTLYEESVLPRNLTQNVGDCSPPSEDKCWLLEYPTSCRQYFKYRHKKIQDTKYGHNGEEFHGAKIKQWICQCAMNNNIFNLLDLQVVHFGLWVPVRQNHPETK